MHFEILIEDQSGKVSLDILIPKIVGDAHTFRVHSYKGIGRIPKNMRDSKDASKRILMDNLPKLFKGYGRTSAGFIFDYPEVVIVVSDLDDKCLKELRKELHRILRACNPRPNASFCIAIEECEAWILGDLPAVKAAYPKAKDSILNSYQNDSICGTWEKLADAVYQGGAESLSAEGWQAVGAEKTKWAAEVSPYMSIENNQSLSFCYFRTRMRELAGMP